MIVKMKLEFPCMSWFLEPWDIKELGGMKSEIVICKLFAQPVTGEDLLLGQWDIDKKGKNKITV